jgi:catechol 2,3-dioxygenase-like lactoylglutathione lyase family enzyme
VLTDHVETTLPASDLDRARAFWEDKVGLKRGRETPVGTYYQCTDGTTFRLFKSSGVASGTHTQLAFVVSDIEREVAELAARGVQFEDYDYPNLKTVAGIAQVGEARAAWFKDSEGNLVVVAQYPEVWA